MENITDFITEAIWDLGRELDHVTDRRMEKLAEIARNDPDPDGKNFIKSVHRATRVRESIYDQIQRSVEQCGYEITVCYLRNGVQGSLSMNSNLIEINTGHHAGVRTALLLHEWAHGILHRGVFGLEFIFNPGPYELEAESVSYIVCKALGINNHNSAVYIRGYRQTREHLFRQAARVASAARKQIDILSAAGLC